MIKQLSYSCAVILVAVLVGHAQQASDAPFSEFEKAVKEEPARWSGNKERLSTVFDAERKRLGDRFESELLKWLRDDPEKHRGENLVCQAASSASCRSSGCPLTALAQITFPVSSNTI